MQPWTRFSNPLSNPATKDGWTFQQVADAANRLVEIERPTDRPPALHERSGLRDLNLWLLWADPKGTKKYGVPTDTADAWERVVNHIGDDLPLVERRWTWGQIAGAANRLSRGAGRTPAPLLNGGSSRSQLIQWLVWNDPSGIYRDEDTRREFGRALTHEEAWGTIADQVRYELP